VSPALSIINELLANYKNYLTGPGNARADYTDAAKTLANIVARILQTPTQDVLEAVWAFFVANKDGVLQEGSALRGVTALDAKTRAKTETVYLLFRLAIKGIDVGNAARVRVDMVSATLKSPTLVLFLQAQAKIVANQKLSTS
jgi:hypothetical protein